MLGVICVDALIHIHIHIQILQAELLSDGAKEQSQTRGKRLAASAALDVQRHYKLVTY